MPVQVLQQYASVLLIAWGSGLSLYLSVVLAGVSGRFGWLELPAGLDALKHPVVIGVAVFMYAIEFVADKVPFVDSAWDSVHTLIRPAGAGLVGFLAGTEYGPVAQAALSVMTGAVALNMHTLKASTRLAINTSPEPFSNIAASVTEDAAVIGGFWFFIKHPILAVCLIILILIASFFVIRLLWQFVSGVFKRIFGNKQTTSAAATGSVEPKPAPPQQKELP